MLAPEHEFQGPMGQVQDAARPAPTHHQHLHAGPDAEGLQPFPQVLVAGE
jgi:hypothetical protein